jgi:hypothetical protein
VSCGCCRCQGRPACGAQVISTDGSVSITSPSACVYDLSVAAFTGARIIQEEYGENQARPTVYDQVAPGGVFQTILTVNITTTIGTYLAIAAALSALTDGGAGSTNVEASIRLLIDGVSSGLGSTESAINDNNNLEPFVAMSLLKRFPLAPLVLAPGPHTVELQWMVQGDGAANKLIGFLSPDQDGCSMFVREMLP